MPFLHDDGSPLGELPLDQRPIDGYRFALRTPVVYLDAATGRTYRAPAAGEAPPPVGITDLASVPTPLWGLIASYGRQSAPAILHDARSIDAARLEDREAALAQRREDDEVFHRALREQGVPVLRARLMWAWVSADRERTYNGWRGGLLLAQVALGVAAVVAAIVLAVTAHPAWLLLALVPALAAFAWGGLAPLVIALTYPLALLGPVLLVQLLAVGVFRAVEAVVELVAGGDVRSVVRPTVGPPADR
ncbi:DUF1353 domain-containing protein [Agromyces marinus]|uniref:DUF1353 domain-containing protein n=1 Tax=Agromyces marinus TaxID=1389020 RepID=A0ABM8H3K2_9MICO|nr:DUF1353 domain-containing protein [Agromyces marinus]UIP59563.1 hypothetical protein DSM26151_24740 [Agromyces marinus]BDZ55379.1 hypothetical protein GCM10025870_24520 [Agromyces marinus]